MNWIVYKYSTEAVPALRLYEYSAVPRQIADAIQIRGVYGEKRRPL